MNNVYLIFYFINIFATQIHSLPTTPSNVYDVVTANFSKNCPILSSNVLVNSTTKYLSSCKDISLINPPERIAAYNINKFYCIGTLVADLQLCNSLTLTKYDYKFLPKNFEDLELQITSLRKMKPVDMCDLLKNIGLFNDTTTISTLSKTITELKQELSGPHCKNLCSDFLNDQITNELCSMMFYIHAHISNVTLTAMQQTPPVVVSNDLQHLAAHEAVPVRAVDKSNNKDLPKHDVITQPQLAEELQNKIKSLVEKQHQEVLNHPPTQTANAVNAKDGTIAPTSPVVVVPSAHESKLEPPVKSVETAIPIESNGKTTIEASSTVPPAVAEFDVQPPLVGKQQKNDQPPLEKAEGEDLPNLTKNTNVTPKDIKSNADQNIGSLFIDGKEDPPTSTELSNKQNSDNIDDEYTNDDDVDDDEGLKIDEPKPKAEKSQEDLISSRVDISPSIKQVIDDDVEESNFFSYFMFISVMFIAGYVVYHNKQKIMALVLEGRRDRNSRRRPSTSSYRKLNSNLEEAVTSKCSGSASHVIY